MARFLCLGNIKAPAMIVNEPYDIEHMRQHHDYVEVDEEGNEVNPRRSEEREPWKMPVGAPTGGPTQPVYAPPKRGRPRKGA